MKQPIEMRHLYEHETDAYNLKGFKPQIVDADYLKQLGVNNLGLEVLQVVSVSLMLVEIAHFNGLFHLDVYYTFQYLSRFWWLPFLTLYFQ